MPIDSTTSEWAEPEESMPQAIEMYRHYDDEDDFVSDCEELQKEGWQVEGIQPAPSHRSVIARLRRRRRERDGLDAHYLRSQWPHSWR